MQVQDRSRGPNRARSLAKSVKVWRKSEKGQKVFSRIAYDVMLRQLIINHFEPPGESMDKNTC
jgi:hypothetical protein